MAFDYELLYWGLEKLAGSFAFCVLFVCLRSCWRIARMNQRAALGDFDKAGALREERRGLLVQQGGGSNRWI